MKKIFNLFFLVSIFSVFFTKTSFCQITISKIEEEASYTYLLSGLHNTSDADSLINIFKSKVGINDVIVDLNSHKIIIHAEKQVLETDIQEIIKFSGKIILKDEKEITKYY